MPFRQLKTGGQNCAATPPTLSQPTSTLRIYVRESVYLICIVHKLFGPRMQHEVVSKWHDSEGPLVNCLVPGSNMKSFLNDMTVKEL